MEYRIISRDVVVIDVVEYTLDSGEVVIQTVPIFSLPLSEEEQIIYKGNLLNGS